MFSANPSISPTGLKPSNVANEVGQGERGRTVGNAVGLWGTRSDYGERGRTRGERGRTRGERGRTRGECGRTGGQRDRIGEERDRTGGNGVGLGETGSNWGERGRAEGTGSDRGERRSDWMGTGVGLGGKKVRLYGNGGRTGRERGSDLRVGLGGWIGV